MTNYTKLTKAQLLAIMAENGLDMTALPTGGMTGKVSKNPNPNGFRITKGTPGERYVTAGGEKIKGYTFATWMSAGIKRASVITGNTLVIPNDGITNDQAQTIVDAWVAKAPKARKTATTVEHNDAWVITA